jgi:hypothetical protein
MLVISIHAVDKDCQKLVDHVLAAETHTKL